MKQKIAIITHSFLDKTSGTSLATGGVETWVLEMVRLLTELGVETTVYQASADDFNSVFEGATVIGRGKNDRKKMLKLSHADIDRKGIERIIYATSFTDAKYMRPGHIFVQHGIHWDYTTSGSNIFSRLKWEYIRRKLSSNDIRMSLKSALTIAVDTNFVNYARIAMKHRFNPARVVYIPNFACPRSIEKWGPKWETEGETRIVFARRFEYRRGVTLFAEVAGRILESVPGAKIVFAGCGSNEQYLLDKFHGNDRVIITEVPHDKIYDLLCNSHIAVIPTLYSEGTSLACLEAMASGCAVVATDVGGLCNIVIPGYSGILVRPIASEIADSVIKLSAGRTEAALIARRGFDLVSGAFTSELWRSRVRKALGESGFLEKT